MPQDVQTAHGNPPSPSYAVPDEDLNKKLDRIAGELYNLASMLVGEGEQSAELVETALKNSEISACHDPNESHKSSQRALAAAALEILARRDQAALAAPEGLAAASICIEGDDLASAGISQEELGKMIAGPDRDRVREWLASLPTAMRAIFVLRAVAGFTALDTAALLKAHGEAPSWTPELTREVFRQGLCSLASQLIHSSGRR
jgi:DNA-directed RNA polymerase specialized sigma24 family protein